MEFSIKAETSVWVPSSSDLSRFCKQWEKHNTGLNMSRMSYLSIIIPIVFITSTATSGQVISGVNRRTNHCNGSSIKLYSASVLVAVFREVQRNINIKVSSALVEGCGCFRLNEKKNHRGRSYLANRLGKHKINLRGVKSVLKIPCSN